MNIEALKRDLAVKVAAAQSKLTTLAATAEKENNRQYTADEQAELNTMMSDAKALKDRIAQLESDASMGRMIEALVPARGHHADGQPLSTPSSPRATASLGQQFVTHEQYAAFFGKGLHRSSSAWRSPSMELWLPRNATTLTTDPASGGDLVIPDFQSGIQQLPTRPLTVADLLAPGTTSSNLITYMKEVTFTNAANTVLEGAAKPESTLVFDAASDPVRKIAHWLPVTEEMLEDVAQIRSYIDARLTLGVQLEEDDQLLNGTVTAPDIVGIRNRVGLAPDIVVANPPTAADAVFQQIMAIYSTSYIMPDGIVMNPSNWATMQLLKSTTGEYIGGGPFNAAVQPTLWGLRVVVTPAMTAGVALVGAYGSAAQIFRKGGIRIEASNSHQDFFVKNLVAIRAEERLALAVYRPSAFGEVTSMPALP